MTAQERDAMIERAMERLHRLREREESEEKVKPRASEPVGIVKDSRRLLDLDRLQRERPDVKAATDFRLENIRCD